MNNRNQIVITNLQEKQLLLMMENDKIYDVLVDEGSSKDCPQVGDIYIGRVQNIVSNINAAFVEIKSGVICYLPLAECGGQKIQCGDEIPVQIKKAAVKSKQAVVTIFPEVAGRYCVVSTKNGTKSVSRKIADAQLREQLKLRLNQEFAKESYGIVLRTNTADASWEEIAKECKELSAWLHTQMEYSSFKTCFTRLRKEVPFYLRYIRSCRMEEIERIITDVPEVYEELHGTYGEQVVLYEDSSYPLDKLLSISTKIRKALEKKVWLKSGGNLVIEPTEALTVIDVNTGKAVEGKRNIETTFFKMNCEAAKEAARQIRMRNLSGIILIDFIDMKNRQNQTALLELLREELKKDKTRTDVIDITKLGLVEITRMKKSRSLMESIGKILQ